MNSAISGNRSADVGFKYERGEHRRKHCWQEDHAGFENTSNGFIGKCPRSIDDSVAQALLDTAIPEPAAGGGKPPKRLFNVYNGVIYVATETMPGVSYHGFPWRCRPGQPRLPKALVETLRERACSAGFKDEFERWMKDFGR